MLKIVRVWLSPIILLCLLILPLVATSPAIATTETNDPHFASVQKRLIKDGFDSEKIKHLYADVSITAMPFFRNAGFRTVRQQKKVYRNCGFRQYIMQKYV